LRSNRNQEKKEAFVYNLYTHLYTIAKMPSSAFDFFKQWMDARMS